MTDVVGTIFSLDEGSVCNGVDYIFLRLTRWREPVVTEPGTRVAIPREGRSIEDQTIDLLEPQEMRIEGERGDTSAYGEQTLTYDVPGMLWLTDDDGDTLISLDLPQYVIDAGEVIIDRRGWGAIKGEIEVLDTVVGEPGDYIDLEAPHQVNSIVAASPVTQRGGSRKVQIVGRTPHAGTATLHLEDAGNLAQTVPTPETPPTPDTLPVPTFTLAADADSPLTVATATVTNDTDLEDFGAIVEWEYAVSVGSPAGDGTPFGPLQLGFGVDEIDTPAVTSGSTVWVRARSFVPSTGERSAWSAWADITLGPATDGGDNGGTIPALALSATINASTGQLDAAATVNGVVTSVKFAVGAAGGVAPTSAAVRAATADTSAPFVAVNLATMAMGEVRTIGAYAYDVLLNESVLVTLTVTRGTTVDTALSWKAPVRVATTVAGTLATSFENGDTVDGVVLATGDRILIKDQAAGAENGIYTVNASGAPTRATDADAGAELVNAATFVSEGTANADTAWVCTTNATITLESTTLTFSRFGVPRVRKNSAGSTFTRSRLNVIEGPGITLTVTDDATDDEVDVTVTEQIVFTVACSDETTALTTGTAKVTFRMGCAVTLSAVRASVTTAPTGAAIIVDINETGSGSILSTLITIDATEKTSTTATAPVISDTGLADDAEITIDIDQVGSTIAGTGLKVTFIGTRA